MLANKPIYLLIMCPLLEARICDYDGVQLRKWTPLQKVLFNWYGVNAYFVKWIGDENPIHYTIHHYLVILCNKSTLT